MYIYKYSNKGHLLIPYRKYTQKLDFLKRIMKWVLYQLFHKLMNSFTTSTLLENEIVKIMFF